MRSARLSSIRKLVVILACALGSHAAAPAQRQDPAPVRGSAAPAGLPKTSETGVLPDIVGLRPGIAFQEARKLLRAYNPKAKIDVGQVQIPELGSQRFPGTLLLTSPGPPGKEAPEIIQLEITLPPEKPVVWGILRRLFFEAGKEMTRTSLLAGLRQKYGSESHGIAVPIVNLYWAFDEQGRRVETGAATYSNCAVPGVWDITSKRGAAEPGSSTFPASSLLLGPAAPHPGPCQPLVYVKALLQPSGSRGLELIESSTVAVINGALAARAQVTTAAYRKTALDAQKTGARKARPQ